LPAKSPGGAVAVQSLADGAQPGAVALSFTGAGETFMRHPEVLDLRRQSNGYLGVALDVKVMEPPSGALTLGMGCGEGCAGAVDIAELLRAAPRDQWTTIVVRLRCMAAAGADMSKIDVPLSIASEGTARLAIGRVELVSASEGMATCPPPHPPR
jgi:beta-glucosidase